MIRADKRSVWRDSNESRGFVPLLAHKHYIEHFSNFSYRFRGKLYRDNYRYRIIAQPYFRLSALLGLVSLIFLLQYPIDSLWVQVRRVCWPIKHSNTMIIEPAFGTFGSVGRCQVLLENEISISIKLVSKRKHEML